MAPLGWQEVQRVRHALKDGDEIEAADCLGDWAVAFEGGESEDFHTPGAAWQELYKRDVQHGEEPGEHGEEEE
jgi:hypothetical protein